MVRQVADEADGVGEQHAAPVADVPLAGAGVERREELVLDVDARLRERVHQMRFAGVGVADERDGMLSCAALDLAFLAGLDLAEAVLEVADAVADEAAVAFELGFAGTTEADAAAFLARKVGPHLLQPRQGVLELRQFHLEPRLGGLRAGGEDVKDEFAAVEDLDTDGLLEVARLGGGEIVIEDDDVGVARLDEIGEFLHLAGADVGGELNVVAFLGEFRDYGGAGVVARPRTSSHGSLVTQGRSGSATLTSTAFRWQPRTRRGGCRMPLLISLRG